MHLNNLGISENETKELNVTINSVILVFIKLTKVLTGLKLEVNNLILMRTTSKRIQKVSCKTLDEYVFKNKINEINFSKLIHMFEDKIYLEHQPY